MLTIRKTKETEIDRLMELFQLARESMRVFNIDQWQDGYPYRENIIEDVKNGESYVVFDEEAGCVVATFMLMKRTESTYLKIYEGSWLDNGEGYATIHRITVDPSFRERAKVEGHGYSVPISRMIADFAKEYATINCLKAGVKVDTHRGNLAMRKMLEKNGFVYCGIIYLENGDERVAYQFMNK